MHIGVNAGRIDELGLQVDTSGDIPDLSLVLEPLNCTVDFFSSKPVFCFSPAIPMPFRLRLMVFSATTMMGIFSTERCAGNMLMPAFWPSLAALRRRPRAVPAVFFAVPPSALSSRSIPNTSERSVSSMTRPLFFPALVTNSRAWSVATSDTRSSSSTPRSAKNRPGS